MIVTPTVLEQRGKDMTLEYACREEEAGRRWERGQLKVRHWGGGWEE